MRSWTTFAIFGIIIVALFIYSNFSTKSAMHHPAMVTTEKFFDCLKNNKGQELEKLVDTKTGKVTRAGDSIIFVSFVEMNTFEGPFVRLPEKKYPFRDINSFRIDATKVPRVMDDGQSASVSLIGDGTVFLHVVDGTWKIKYIDEPKSR